ncbi:MAG: SBBP repeat-containing protein [Ignavibacteria bacterium]
MKKTILTLFIVFVSSAISFSQVRQDHVSFYGGDLSGKSFGSFVKTDREGNYFVAGRSSGLGTNFDYAIVKYSSAGTVLWERRYNGVTNNNDEPFGLLIDDAGNSYITGSSVYGVRNLSECVTIKYNPQGDIQWINKYRRPGNINSHGHSMAVDQTGNVYLAGYTGTEDSKDIMLLRINSNGETIWERSFDANTFSGDYTNMIYLYKEHIYICGSAIIDNANFLDYIILKYNVNGDLLWQRSHNGNLNGFDVARAIFVDKNENVYVTGYTENAGTELDITTIKYNYDGALIWKKDFNGTGNGYDWPNHVLVDDLGNVYVEGGTQNERETNPECHSDLGKCRNDATLIKYLASGDLDWVRLYNGPDNMYDCLQGMVMDNENNIYVAGRSHSEFYSSDDDIITMKYNSQGERLWFMKYNSGTSKPDYGNAIAVDNLGNVFTSGWSDARGETDFVVIKYAPASVRDDQAQDISLDNYPNPFNPSTKISFYLVQSSKVKLTIYDVRGRELSVLADEFINSGNHSYTFDAGKLNSGVYFYKFEAEGADGNKLLMTKKMILLK